MMPMNEIEEELRFHIEARAADLEKRGRTPQQALREARLEFGSIPRYVEEGREAKGYWWRDAAASMMEAVRRFVRRDPVFHLLTTAVLAMAIGGATLVFSLAYRFLAASVPYPDAERIYSARVVIPIFGDIHPDLPVSAAYHPAWRASCTACEETAVIDVWPYELTTPQDLAIALQVTPGFFRITGIQAELGRVLGGSEEGPTVLLTHGFWMRRFQADPGVIGRTISMNGVARRIVGVLPADTVFPRGEQLGDLMHYPSQIDMVVPQPEDGRRRGAEEEFRWSMLVKLQAGARPEEAERQLDQALVQFRTALRPDIHAKLTPLTRQFAMGAFLPLQHLCGAAVLLLLVVCVQFGSIQLARLSSRRRDLALRSAMGASRGALIRHALSEGLALAATGSLLGGAAAWLALRLLSQYSPNYLPPLDGVAIHPAAWAVCAGAVFASGAVAILIPLLRSRQAGPRRGLVFCAAAGSVALSAVAGLLLLSYVRLRGEDHGFSAASVSAYCIGTPESMKVPAERRHAHEAMLRQIRTLPGVEVAAVSSRLPLIGEARIDPLRRPGEREQGPMATWRHVTPGYFAAVRTELIAGREFNDSDRDKYVAIISDRAAREQFPGQDPIGKTIEQPEEDGTHLATVVGVAEEVKSRRIEAAPPLMVYVPQSQSDKPEAFYVVRSRPGADVTPDVLRAVAAQGMHIIKGRITPLQRLLDDATGVRRWHAQCTAAFALIAVFAACLGLFTMVRDNVSRRTAEIGVRMALGATPGQTARMLLRESLRPVWFGAVAGLAAAVGLGRLIAPQLYAVSPYDPGVLLLAALAVAIAAAVAAYLSVRRAVHIEPLAALRAE